MAGLAARTDVAKVMSTMRVAWAVLACLFPHVAGAADASGSKREAGAQVEAIARDLAAGTVNGEWDAWERHASDDLLYTTELGRTLTKHELRAVFAPPAPQRRTVEMSVVGVRTRSDAAVLVYELSARDPDGVERYRITDTYWRIGGAWKLVASQAGVAAADPDPPPHPVGGDSR